MFYGADLAYIQRAGFGELTRGASAEIIRRLRAAGAHSVIDAGCGAGPLSQALIEAGFEVTGIDVSAELLAIACANVPHARFLCGSVYNVPLPACDAVLAVGEVLSYHRDSAGALDRVRAFFARAAAVLRPGGLFIFDLIETGEPPLTGRFWTADKDWAVLVHTEENGATLVRRIESFRRTGELYRRSGETHHVQLFERRWVLEELGRSGFAVEIALAYGEQALPPRRCAFFCTRQS